MRFHPTTALLCSVLAACFFSASSARAQVSNALTREVYLNITGGTIPELTNNPAYPNSPNIQEILTTSWDVPQNAFENYGTRLRALVVPPVTGSYTFWISGDDNCQLFLSTDANPANRVLIARVNTWTSWKEWTKETNQQSAPIALVGGQQYYLEALQKEGGGGDNLTVRWQLPGGAIEEPLPATRCITVGVAAPVFTQQPTNVTVIEGNQTTFAVRFGQSWGATMQWRRNGTNLSGETGTNLLYGPVSLSDSGAVFSCLVANPYGSVVTTNARLSVIPDTAPPTITTVGNLGDNDLITVVFSEPVEAATALVTGNYSINNGVGVASVSYGVDTRTIVLTTTPLTANVTYTLTVNNVRDRASTPNTIAANTQRTFSINTRPLDISFLRPGAEVPGPSTRRGPLIISEVMYHPTNRTDLRNIEFIEIFNSNPWFEEMGGYRISGAIDYTFPSNFVLQGRSYVVVAAVPADVQAVYGITGVLGPWIGALENSEGTLRLRNKQDAILFEMDYTGDAPFPAAADGAGHSLVLARPSYGEADPRAWSASDVIGGTPRTNEVAGANPWRTVMINELLAHTDLPDVDYVELYNYSSTAVNVGLCVLTDDAQTNKFIIPTNTVIPANGYLVFTEAQLGFALSADGETVYFKNPSNTRVLDALRFAAQENGVAWGRAPDGAANFYRLQSKTPGAANLRPRVPLVVFNELMYDPLSADDFDEFIELHNPNTNAINVGRWRIRGGVSFNIPNGTMIPANGYLVIGGNSARLRANYPNLNFVNCLGDWSGSLKNRGERLTLSMPDTIVSTNGTTNTIHIPVDEVTYADGGRWGKFSAGGGSSMELRDARADRRLAPNWGDSIETAKQGWVNVEATGTMDNGLENSTQLHITLQGAGEVLIDNVEVVGGTWGTNLIGNGTFDTDASGWIFQGNHNATSLETAEGYLSPRSLHLRADGRGDHGANRIRYQLPFTVANGTANVTLRAKVRWLKGNPNILLRMRGNYHEASAFTLTAKNLGTPGLPNSIRVTNAPPAITDVAHWPPLPAASVPVLVTARANDPDGLASMLLSYRIDPATNFTSVSMTNNGAGVYSAVLPGQLSGTTAAFYVQAADKLSPALGAKFPSDAPVRECVVRWGDTAVGGVGLGTYRFWITQKVIDQWVAEERMSNKAKDVTYIYGTNRVVYNAGAWFHGSPYHSPAYNSPVGNLCDYDMGFPPDDRLYGETDINLFRPGNGGGDGTAQTEVHAYWFGGQFGAPFLYHRPVFMYVNGALRGVHYDAQQPNGDFVDQWYPDDADGELHKIQIGFEFGDTAYGNGESGFSGVGANFGRYTTVGGAFKQGRYRATLPWRSTSPDEQLDYTNIYALVNNTLTTAPLNSDAYTTVLTNTFDVREWYQTHVVQHLICNNDSFSYGGGQNAFMYKPAREKWKLFLWDVDFAFGGTPADTTTFLNIGGADHGPRNDHAPFRRIYWQCLIEAANGMMTPARSDTILDARYNGMIAHGMGVGSPSGIKSHIVARRAALLSVIASNNLSGFAIESNGGADFSTANNLVTLTGRAPFEVDRIEVNGVAYHVTWTTVTNWSLRVALPTGTNALSVVAYDRFGSAVSNATDTINVNVTAPGAPPQDNLVINEILFDPLVPDAEFIELFNQSFTVSFDVSGWRLDGLDYVFPDGFIIQPRAFILLAKDPFVFTQAYGTNVTPHGVFNGNLQANGETITFVKPGLTPATDQVIDKIRYEAARPWTTNANHTGASIQLIDAAKDNTRPGNWWAESRPAVYTPEIITHPEVRDGWRFFSASGSIGNGESNGMMRLVIYLHETGSALIDDVSIVAGTSAAVGYNYVRNGSFDTALDTGLTNSWLMGTNYTNSLIVSDLVHAGTGALKIVGTFPGLLNPPTFNRVIQQYLSPAPLPNSINTLSFWYWATNSATNLNMRIRNSLFLQTATNAGPTNINIFMTASNYVPPQLVAPATNTLTPGAVNQGAVTISPIPALWLNEVQAENLSGPLDNNSEREPWVELHNSGTNTVTLTNLWLADNYTNLLQWAFPAGATLAPGQFKLIFCDGQPAQTTSNEWHTSFRLGAGAGKIALSRVWNSTTQTLDYLNYVAAPDRSFGAFPDGQLFTRQEFFFVTPAATNNGTLPPVSVVINEWMADNAGALADPADGNYEDWFELFNNSASTVSLGGYFLTDELTNKFKFEIPPGVTIPPYGHLLVWADNEPQQNAVNTGDLHANFSLAKSGDSLGLFTPDGLAIDTVSFLGQITDVTTGHFPDGTGPLNFMFDPTPRAANYIPQPNVAPVIDPISNRTMFEGEPLLFTATATDSNVPAQALTWSLLAGAPAGAIIASNTGAFGWVPGEDQGGNVFNISVRVSDNGSPSLSHTQSFSVTVLKTNSAPALAIGGGRFVNEGATLSFTAVGTDGDLPAQTLTYALDGAALALGASINASNGIFTWTPGEIHGPGAYTLTISVTDNGTPALSNSALVTITVNESNTPPALAAITNYAVALGELVTFTASATDGDLPAQLITYDFAAPPPAGATVNAINGLFTWTANTVGTNTFLLRATDNGPGAFSDTKTFEVVVSSADLVTSIGLSNSVVLLSWSAISNRTYQVDYKNNLSETNWTPLVTNIVTSATGTATDAVGTNTQRLYRIVLLP